MDERRAKWEERYTSGPRPWDTGITPPEVVDFWKRRRVTTGQIALDLGCGTGTNVAWLAATGLTAIGVELSYTALQLAYQRRETLKPPARDRLRFVQGDVSRVPFFRLNACYILDIGCFHALPSDARIDYANGVAANLEPGGYFHLFAFDRLPEDADAPDARGVGENEVADLFAPELSVVEIIRGRPDHRPCRWYLLQKSLPEKFLPK